MIDAFGEGFHLTNLSEGVPFRILSTREPSQVSWLDPRWNNGWLALDRNGNGRIDNFTELFGDLTPQPRTNSPNGFIALAVFDLLANGGNGNGVIDPGDAIYEHLQVWIDSNHNGLSEPEELHSLPSLGIFRIDLKYALSSYIDQNGNQFRYKGRIWDEYLRPKSCYDVFLQVAPPDR